MNHIIINRVNPWLCTHSWLGTLICSDGHHVHLLFKFVLPECLLILTGVRSWNEPMHLHCSFDGVIFKHLVQVTTFKHIVSSISCCCTEVVVQKKLTCAI